MYTPTLEQIQAARHAQETEEAYVAFMRWQTTGKYVLNIPTPIRGQSNIERAQHLWNTHVSALTDLYIKCSYRPQEINASRQVAAEESKAWTPTPAPTS